MTDQEPQRKKGGRPRRHSPDAKRPTMAFRMGSQLHEQLIASAAANERSLSEEIERRLEESYTQQDRFVEMLGGYKNLSLIMAITTSWNLIEKLAKKSWTESHDVFDAMRAATDNAFVISKSFIDANAKKPANTLLDMKNINELTSFEDIKHFAEAAAVYGSSMANGREPSKKLLEVIKDTSARFNGLLISEPHASDA